MKLMGFIDHYASLIIITKKYIIKSKYLQQLHKIISYLSMYLSTNPPIALSS